MLRVILPQKRKSGNFLVFQWLRIHIAVQRKWVLSLIEELRSLMPKDNEAHAATARESALQQRYHAANIFLKN